MAPRARELTGWTNEMNVTPMIDVLLVLLIIFMMMVPLMSRRIDAQLPDPAATAGDAVGIVLEVLPAGAYRLNQSPISAADLGTRLRAAYAGRPDKTLMLKGSPEATYQEIVAAMDSARGAGVLVIGMHPKP